MLNSFQTKSRTLFNELQLATRMSTWLCDFVMSARPQQDLCLLGDYLSVLMMTIHNQAGAFMGFVSEPYFATLNGVFSLLQNTHMSDHCILLNETAAMDAVIERFADMTVMTLDDPHIVLPHIREEQQQRLPFFFTSKRFQRVFMASKYCQKHVIPKVMHLCCTKDKAQLTRQVNTLTFAFQGKLFFDQYKTLPDSSPLIDSFLDVAANDKELFHEVLNNIFEGMSATISNFYTSLDSVCSLSMLLLLRHLFHVLFLDRFRTLQMGTSARSSVRWNRLVSLQS